MSASVSSRKMPGSRRKPRRMWVFGACFVTTTCSVTSAWAFCPPSLTLGRSTRHRRHQFHGDRIAHRNPASAIAMSNGRAGRSPSMKLQKARKSASAQGRRRVKGGPRFDAEGYTEEAFAQMKHEVAFQVAATSPSPGVKKVNFKGGLDSCPCLVLNADYQPLSYLPLSLWGWQDVIKAVFMNKVTVVATYGDRSIRSARMEVQLPSVIALKEFVNQHRTYPAFTRRNLFLRDAHKCQYCLKYFPPQDLSFDHVLPKKLGGKGTWDNVVTACGKCNNRKSDCHPRELRTIGMRLSKYPRTPTFHELQSKARKYPPKQIHETWEEFLYFESEIDEEEGGVA